VKVRNKEDVFDSRAMPLSYRNRSKKAKQMKRDERGAYIASLLASLYAPSGLLLISLPLILLLFYFKL
jgi:hypothetical protein